MDRLRGRLGGFAGIKSVSLNLRSLDCGELMNF